MKTYKNLYPRLCSYKNLELDFKKASKGKNKKFYVIEFKKNLTQNLLALKRELENETYIPKKLKKFTIRDPKTRLIRKISLLVLVGINFHIVLTKSIFK